MFTCHLCVYTYVFIFIFCLITWNVWFDHTCDLYCTVLFSYCSNFEVTLIAVRLEYSKIDIYTND